MGKKKEEIMMTKEEKKKYQHEWYLKRKAGIPTDTRVIKIHARNREEYSLLWQKMKREEKAAIQTEDKIQCKICGGWYRKVGQHVWLTHRIRAKEYRRENGFDVKRGQIKGRYLEKMHSYVFKNGTVDNLKKGAKFRFKKGQKGLGLYQRSLQTLERLSQLWRTR